MKTSFGITYELVDTGAITDSAPSATENMPFADEVYLKQNTAFPDYQTLEQDYFLLGGSMPELPDEPQGIPFWTSSLSGTDGTFENNPLLIITFAENHTSAGLTFHFVGDWPILMQVRWYDMSGNTIAIQSYQPDKADYYARNLVENYAKLEIEFLQAKPFRYVKLYGLDYGTTLVWGENDIKTASLVEETDPISNTMKANKLTFQFVDLPAEFDVSNPDGLHKALQKNQYMEPYELVDGVQYPLGRYFLTSPSNTKKLAKMDATDYIGLLDNTEFRDGRVYDGDMAGAVLAELFAGTDIPYTVDPDVAETPLTGWLKIQSRRKALREILFACGAAAETARREDIHIFKPDRKIRSKMERARKFSTSAKKSDYISDVTVKYTVYTPGTEEKELIKASTYPSGKNTVQFSEPVTDVRISTGSILAAGTNYLTFELQKAAEVTVFGKPYTKQDASAAASIEKLDAGEVRKTKNYTAALCDYSRAKAVADAILEYHKLTLALDVRYLARDERPCSWAEIENPEKGRGSYVAGLESITTDLTGGYISKAKLIGYYRVITDNPYTGTELFTGEGVGML